MKSSSRTASLQEALHELYLTPCAGRLLSTLAYEGDKNTTKCKLKTLRRRRISNVCRRSSQENSVVAVLFALNS